MVWPNSTLSWLVRSWSPFGPLLPMNNSISGDVWQYEAYNIKNNPNVMFTIRTWLVVLLGAAISVIVNSACAGFLSGVGLISLSSILFPPFYNKLQVHSSIMIGRDKNGKLKWRDQGVSGSDFLFPNTSCFYLFLPPGSPCLSILLLGLSGRFFLKSALGGRRWSRTNSNYDM